MEPWKRRETEQNVAGFIVAAGLIMTVFGVIVFVNSMYAAAFWKDARSVPVDVQNAIDDGFWRGRLLIVIGLLVAVGAWVWWKLADRKAKRFWRG